MWKFSKFHLPSFEKLLIIFLFASYLTNTSGSSSSSSSSSNSPSSQLTHLFKECENAQVAVRGCNVIGLGLCCSDGTLLASLPLPFSAEQEANLRRHTIVGTFEKKRTRVEKEIANDPTVNTATITKDDIGKSIDSIGAARWIAEDPRHYLHQIDESICACIVGISSDCQYLVNLCKRKAAAYRATFGVSIPLMMLADFVSHHLYILGTPGRSRPLAVDIILAGRDKSIIKVDCTGSYHRTSHVAFTDSVMPVDKQPQISTSNDDVKNALVYRLIEKIVEPSNQWTDMTCLQASEIVKSLYLNETSHDKNSTTTTSTTTTSSSSYSESNLKKGNVFMSKWKSREMSASSSVKRPLHMAWVSHS